MRSELATSVSLAGARSLAHARRDGRRRVRRRRRSGHQLSEPTTVAIGPDGDLYISDPGKNRIRKGGPQERVRRWGDPAEERIRRRETDEALGREDQRGQNTSVFAHARRVRPMIRRATPDDAPAISALFVRARDEM